MPGEAHRKHSGDERHGRRARDAQAERWPEAEPELGDADGDAVHAAAEKQRLSERQQPDVAEEQIDARGEQRPDQDLGDHADPEAVGDRRHQPGHREQKRAECAEQRALDLRPRHRASPRNSPCGRASSTTLISTSEVMRA